MIKTRKITKLNTDVEITEVNGVPWLHFRKPGEPFTIHMVFGYGANTETKLGAAHFMEHMVMSGSEKFPNRKELSDALNKRGGSIGACTNYMHINISILNDSSDDSLFTTDILDQVLLHSKFDPISIENERSTILKEIDKTSKEKKRVTNDLFLRCMYHGTRLSKDIKGESASLATITRDDLMSNFDLLLHSKRALVTAGDFPVDEIKDDFGRLLGQLPIPVEKNAKERKLTVNTGHYNLKHPLGVMGVGMLFPMNVYGNKRKTAIYLMLKEIVFGYGSPLLNKLRYENGLTYTITSYCTSSYLDDRFGVFTEISPDRIDQAKNIFETFFFEELPKLITKDIISTYANILDKRERRRFQTGDNLVNYYSSDFLELGIDMPWYDEFVSILQGIEIKEVSDEIGKIFTRKKQSTIVFS